MFFSSYTFKNLTLKPPVFTIMVCQKWQTDDNYIKNIKFAETRETVEVTFLLSSL